MGNLENISYQGIYADALEHIEKIFNQLCIKKRFGENCKECPFLTEIETMRLLAKDQQFMQIEQELGYHLQ